MNLEKRIKAIILSVLNSKDNENDITITENTDLLMDLNFDSIQMIRMVVELEEEFEVVFEDEDLELDNLSTLKCLVKVIQKKVNS